MVKSNGSVSAAPFLKKCYEMVDDESTDSIISWAQNDHSFIIWDMTQFSVLLLPKYFKHSNFSSFIRQLNIYGFRKVDTDRWEFANEDFVKGKKHLLGNIARRKNAQGTDQRKSSQQVETVVEPSENVGNSILWKEVEKLKTDKKVAAQELGKLKQNQETTDKKLLVLRERLQGTEKSQQQMLSFLLMAVQSPGFLAQLFQPNNWRMAEVTEVNEPETSNNMIVRYQPPAEEKPEFYHKPVAHSKNQPDSNPSDGTKDFVMNIDFMRMLMEENHPPFVTPDLHDESEWAKLLLGSPRSQNIQESWLDEEGQTSLGMEVEPIVSTGILSDKLPSFEDHLLKEIGKCQDVDSEPTDDGSHSEESQSLESLTEKMELLASESNHNFSIT